MEVSEYGLYSKIEDNHWWFRGRRKILSTFISLIPVAERRSVLEVGCGTGGNLKYLFDSFVKRTGLECNSSGVEFAQKKLGGQASVVPGDANNLSAIDEKFNCVAFLDVLYHQGVKDVQGTLKQACDRLDDGGYLLITDGAYGFLQGKHARQVHSARRFTKGELIELLTSLNFEVVKASYWGLLLFFLLVVKRLVVEKMTAMSDAASTDVVTVPIVDSVLYRILTWEACLMPYLSFPFGASIAVLARKKK